jgi:hypothetical protein
MFSLKKTNRAVLIMETRCIYSDVGNYFMCYLDELQASQFEQNLSNFD